MPKRKRIAKASPPAEVGRTGLKIWAGRVGEEFHRDLQYDRAPKFYREMADNDATIGAMFQAITALLGQVVWRVEPYLDGPEEDERIEFLEGCMHDMRIPWPEFIRDVTQGTLTYGWGVHEIVYKQRKGWPVSMFNDGLVGWDSFAPRGQDTLSRWITDGDRVTAFEQIPPPDYRTRIIPLDKCLHFTVNPAKGNPEGKSVLRNAFRAWRAKMHIENIEGVGIERDMAGLPIAYVPPVWLAGGGGTAEQAAMGDTIKDIVVNIRRDAQEGVVLPLLYDENGNQLVKLELLSSGGERQFDTDKIISRYDQRILQLMMADFLLLGHEKVGSFALSSDKTALFALALGVWLDRIADVLNSQAVPRLLSLNGMEVEGHPRFVHGDLESRNLVEVADYVSKLAAAGAPFFPDAKLTAKLLDLADLPVPPPEELERRAEEAQQDKEFQQELDRTAVEAKAAGKPAKDDA